MDWTIDSIRTERGHRHKHNTVQGRTWGPMIFLSAIRGTSPETGELPAEIGEQARQSFRNLADVLQAAGSSLDQVLRVGIYMIDLQRDRPALNVVWREVFGDTGPARFAVEVSDLGAEGDKSRLLLDVIAVRGPWA